MFSRKQLRILQKNGDQVCDAIDELLDLEAKQTIKTITHEQRKLLKTIFIVKP